MKLGKNHGFESNSEMHIKANDEQLGLGEVFCATFQRPA